MADKRNPVEDLTASLYRGVIDDVAARIKPEFLQEGIDESVLDELRALWEANLLKSDVCRGSDPVAAAMAAEASRQQKARSKQQQQQQQQQQQPIQAAHHAHAFPYAAPPLGLDPRLQQYMVQAALPHLMQAMPPGLAAAYGGLPQHQHQPVVQLPAQAAAAAAAALENARKRRAAEVAGGAPPLKQQQLAPGSIPQQDGPADDACEGPSAGGVVKSEGEDAGAALGEDLAGSDEELNEDDDLAAVDDKEVNEDEVKDCMLGQFDKVQRSKARWRVGFKDCILTLGGRDYLLHKVTGEMNF